jgi:hypothetical protein
MTGPPGCSVCHRARAVESPQTEQTTMTDTHINPPADSQDAPSSPLDGLYLPTDISSEDLFLAIGRLRKEAGDEVDRLLQF